MKRLWIWLLIGLLSLHAVLASSVDVHLFYGKGCQHCAKAIEYIESLDDPDVVLSTYEVYFDQDNRVLFEKFANEYNETISGVPTIFIGEKIFVGFGDHIQEQLQQQIDSCKTTPCQDHLDKISQGTSVLQKITIPAVISAAAVDAINPCAFAVLIILITAVLASKDKQRALFAGLAFSLSIFISYFLMGVGLYSAIGAAGIGHAFFIVVSILAILIGVFNLKDYFWYGKWFVMEVPLSWRPRLQALLRKVTSVPGAFFTGIVVSLFLLPCTSGPYIVILGLLAHVTSRQSAMWLLVLYNMIFVLPMIIITLVITFGMTTAEKAESWRTEKIKCLHLIAGILLLLLGIGMMIAVFLGKI